MLQKNLATFNVRNIYICIEREIEKREKEKTLQLIIRSCFTQLRGLTISALSSANWSLRKASGLNSSLSLNAGECLWSRITGGVSLRPRAEGDWCLRLCIPAERQNSAFFHLFVLIPGLQKIKSLLTLGRAIYFTYSIN